MIDGAPVSSGLASLDRILGGGYAANRAHLIEGEPGTGKTTLALQFLVAGRDRGEKCLFITISESPFELKQVAVNHGLSLDGIELFDCIPPELSLDPERYQSIMHAADLELGESVHLIMAAVMASQPSLVVLDSLSEIRLLAQDPLRYRRQILALKHFFFQQHCTVLCLDDLTIREDDLALHSIGHGVIRLEQMAMTYGAERRRLRVYKMRSRAFQGGYHDFVIRTGGLAVFPRLAMSGDDPEPVNAMPLVSGIDGLDALLGGGLDAGTTTLIQGASGTGKSTLALQLARAGLARGEKALLVSFEESRRNFSRRATGMGMEVETWLERGLLAFVHIDPAETSAGEISDMIRRHVIDGARVVILDSLIGYQHALGDENHLLLHMHELLAYLNHQGVSTLLMLAQSGVIGPLDPPFDMTYLADTVLLIRYFEAAGEARRLLSVIKKRTGTHESMSRELFFDDLGLQVGQPLTDLQGVLADRPRHASAEPLLAPRQRATAVA